MRITRRSFDVGTGLVLLAAGGLVWWEGWRIPPSFLGTDFGTGYLPMLAGAGLCLLACVLILDTLRDRGEGIALNLDARLARPAVTTLALVLLVVNLNLRLVPFYPAAGILIFAVAAYLGDRSPRSLIAAAACATLTVVAAWLVFTRVFVVLIG